MGRPKLSKAEKLRRKEERELLKKKESPSSKQTKTLTFTLRCCKCGDDLVIIAKEK